MFFVFGKIVEVVGIVKLLVMFIVVVCMVDLFFEIVEYLGFVLMWLGVFNFE